LVRLTATIIEGGAERSFRYASLASGLDLVRRLSVSRTSRSPRAPRWIRGRSFRPPCLSMLLASGSLPSLASLPGFRELCPSQGRCPHLCRRYALFALVGIAGEDDLDAPDIPRKDLPRAEPAPPTRGGNGRAFAQRLTQGAQRASAPAAGRHRRDCGRGGIGPLGQARTTFRERTDRPGCQVRRKRPIWPDSRGRRSAPFLRRFLNRTLGLTSQDSPLLKHRGRSLHSQRGCEGAARRTWRLSPPGTASSARRPHATRIISKWPSPNRWGGKSAMSSLCRYAADIIVSCTQTW
jgi:hypothetical protein